MCFPQMIVHEVDAWSPLMPPPIWRSITDGKIYKWKPSFYQQKDSQQKDNHTCRDSMGQETTMGVDRYPSEENETKKYQAFCFPNVPGRSCAYAGNTLHDNTFPIAGTDFIWVLELISYDP